MSGKLTGGRHRQAGKVFTVRQYASSHVGFAWLRLIGSVIVVTEHSWLLSGNSRPAFFPDDWGVTPGYVALMAFFAMSGYQISGSWERDPSWWRYTIRRVLRIWPPLLVVVMISAFVIGPLVTILPSSDYWQSAGTWSYVVHNAELYPIQHLLPGVFLDNPYPWSVNGSIWTLPMEATGYLLLLIMGVAGVLRGRAAVMLLPVLGVMMFLDILFGAHVDYGGRIGAFLGMPLGPCVAYLVAFVVGMILFSYRDRIPLKGSIAAILVAIYVASNWTPVAQLVLPIMAGYGAIVLAYHWPTRLSRGAEWIYGSYGMYVWGCPVQQLLAYGGVRTSWMMIAMAVPLAYLCGLASWHLVEVPTQSLRVYLRPIRRRGAVATHVTTPVSA